MNLSSSEDLAVEGMMYFLSRDDRYNQEKPYTLRFTPGGGLPQTNIDRTQYSIKFHDMRKEQNLRYNKCGFKVATLHSQMQYEDYDDIDKVESIHGPEVAGCVKGALKATSAEVLDYVVSQLSCRCMTSVAINLIEPQIRRRHPTWPIATGETYSFQQPASRAHIGNVTYASWLFSCLVLTSPRSYL
jgi:hypothetical protein